MSDIVCTVSNELEVTGLPPYLQEVIREKSQFTLWDFDGNRTDLNYFRSEGNSCFCPRGLFEFIKAEAELSGLNFHTIYRTAKGQEQQFEVNPSIKYEEGDYAYQGYVINQLEKFNTVRLQAPAGSGKTCMACLFANLLQRGPILFLTERDKLVRQFINTATKVLGVPKDEVGIIKGDKYKIKPLTVGSLKTLAGKRFKIKEIKDKFHTVFFDECHLSSATTYREVIRGLAPRHLIGLSATPEHYSKDQISALMEALLGPVGVVITNEDVPGRMMPEVLIRYTGEKFKYINDRKAAKWMQNKRHHKLYNDVAESRSRNELIVKDCQKMVKAGLVVLIATQRVIHAKALSEMLEMGGIVCSFPYQYKIKTIIKNKKNVRQYLLRKVPKEQIKIKQEEEVSVDHKKLDEDLEKIEAGEIKVLLGTYSLFDTGFDCPIISAIQFAAPFSGSNSTKVIQCGGRVQRRYFGKEHCVIINYVDESYPDNRLGDWGQKQRLSLIAEFGNCTESFVKKT